MGQDALAKNELMGKAMVDLSPNPSPNPNPNPNPNSSPNPNPSPDANPHPHSFQVDLSDLMRTADFAQEIRTRVELDTQGYVELSVSYELEDAYNPLKVRVSFF